MGPEGGCASAAAATPLAGDSGLAPATVEPGSRSRHARPPAADRAPMIPVGRSRHSTSSGTCFLTEPWTVPVYVLYLPSPVTSMAQHEASPVRQDQVVERERADDVEAQPPPMR